MENKTADVDPNGCVENKDSNAIDLDHVIREIGEFKRSQIIRFVLMSIPTAMATTLLFNYVFTVAILDYR